MELPSEMPYFIVPDATLQQLKCHTPLSETYGIPESHLFIFTSYKSPLRSFRLRTLP